ncbi:MAG: hypothetical protein WCI04_07320, partial [archaeon]
GYSDGVEVKSGYDPTIPAPGDKLASTITPKTPAEQLQDTAITPEKPKLTDELIQKLQNFTNSKNGQAITQTDMQSTMGTFVAEKTGNLMTWENLPEIDRTQIKILKQPYASLKEADKKVRLLKDSANYLSTMSYLLISNSPNSILTDADTKAFIENFLNKLAGLTSPSPDLVYFADLGNRTELFLNQVNEITVPETMLELHVKFLRLLRGALTMQEVSSPVQDPIASMIVMTKVQNLTDLLVGFFGNDFQNYFNQLGNTQK